MTAELNLELCLFEEECPNHSNHCCKLGYPNLHCFCSTCVKCSSPVLKLPVNGCRMLCSCRGMMLFAGHCGLKSVGELLVIFQFVAWSWILDKNLISTKQVDFLCRPFPSFTFLQRFPSAPARSNAANTFDCSRFFGKKNATKYWLTQKGLHHVKVRVEEWDRTESMKGGMEKGCLQGSVSLRYLCHWEAEQRTLKTVTQGGYWALISLWGSFIEFHLIRCAGSFHMKPNQAWA